MKPKKHLGQNFLINKTIIKKIIASVNLENKVVLEIGPGRGALSLGLLEEAKMLYAFEIDESLKEYLDPLEESNNNFKVIYGDVLNFNFSSFAEEIKETNLTMVANIPYYITGLLLKKIKETKEIKEAVIMMQKEVAERLLSSPNNKEYGALTVVFNLCYEIKRVTNVKKTSFYPAPKVDSVVLKFVRTDKYIKELKSLERFNKFIEASFKMKRKTLVNNLSTYYKISKEEVIEKLLNVEPDYNVLERAENITVSRFIAFSNGWDL